MAEIVHDLFPLMRVYKDGRIERLMGEGFVPPESDPEIGVQIKDVEIDPQINLSARLYLPKNVDSVQEIPLFVYFHGGAFVIESASSPIAYEDSWVALKWIASHAAKGDGHEPWIKDHADFNRVYFGGDSAGGNIAHHMAIRVGLEKLKGVKLVGIFLACPYFWGKDLIDGDEEYLVAKDFIDKLWLFANPNRSGLDDPLINAEKDPKLCSLGCEKVLVYLAGKDPLRYRGFYYKEALEKSGWPGTVEVVEVKDEAHVFHLFAPEAENAIAMLKKLVSFLNQGDV